MTLEQIQAAIPHRPPMLLVDEIIRRDRRRIECRKTFRDDEFFVQGHYPGHPIVPGVILCEAAMQAGAVLLSEHMQGAAEHSVPVATRMSDVKFRKIVRPGDTVHLIVELQERLADAFFLKATIQCAAKTVARLDFACTLATAQ
jgi:3-hydroxyacyl-[acyl-carrier-protein] dehydratase